MSQQRAGTVSVVDRDGLRGTIDASSPELRSNHGQVLVQLDNGRQALVPVDALILQNDGSFTLPFALSGVATGGTGQSGQMASQMATGGAAEASRGRARAAAASGRDPDETVVVPVIAERLDVQKRTVESGGVRIRKVVHEREEIVDEPLIREEVQVKRVPVNRVVDGPIPVRHVGNTMIVSLLEEVLVVEKRLMLKEELHITKGEVETYKPQRITLRTEEAHIERVDAAGQATGQQVRSDLGATTDADATRANFNTGDIEHPLK